MKENSFVMNVKRKSSEKTRTLFQAHLGSLHLGRLSGKLPLRRVTKKKRKYYGTEIRIEGQKGEE
jgi:hypothetical protein